MEKIKISLEKIVTVDGERKMTMQVSGMAHKYDLPQEYLDAAPAVWQDSYTDNRILYIDDPTYGVRECPLNDTRSSGYPPLKQDPATVEHMIELIQLAGERLHKINARIARERAMYAGKSEIII
jgi:hypothetical protein